MKSYMLIVFSIDLIKLNLLSVHVECVGQAKRYFQVYKTTEHVFAIIYYQCMCMCMHFIPSHYDVPKRRIPSPASPSYSKKAPPVTSPLPLTTVCCRTDRQRFLDKSS